MAVSGVKKCGSRDSFGRMPKVQFLFLAADLRIVKYGENLITTFPSCPVRTTCADKPTNSVVVIANKPLSAAKIDSDPKQRAWLLHRLVSHSASSLLMLLGV